MKDRENVAAVGNACTPPQQRLPPPGFSAVVPCSSTPATDTRAWLESQLRQANETMAPIVQDRGQFAALLQRVERVLPGDHVLQGRVANMRARAHPAPAELPPPGYVKQATVYFEPGAPDQVVLAHERQPCQQVLLPEEPLEQPEAAAEVQPGAEERGAPGGAPARPLQHKVDRLMGDAEPQEGEEQAGVDFSACLSTLRTILIQERELRVAAEERARSAEAALHDVLDTQEGYLTALPAKLGSLASQLGALASPLSSWARKGHRWTRTSAAVLLLVLLVSSMAGATLRSLRASSPISPHGLATMHSPTGNAAALSAELADVRAQLSLQTEAAMVAEAKAAAAVEAAEAKAAAAEAKVVAVVEEQRQQLRAAEVAAAATERRIWLAAMMDQRQLAKEAVQAAEAKAAADVEAQRQRVEEAEVRASAAVQALRASEAKAAADVEAQRQRAEEAEQSLAVAAAACPANSRALAPLPEGRCDASGWQLATALQELGAWPLLSATTLAIVAYLVVIQCQFGIMCCVSGLESAAARIPGAAFRTAVIGTPMWLVMRWLMSF